MFPSSLQTTQSSVTPEKRAVKEVPFVEMLDGRVQGVVSSGSDIQRVYIAYFETRTLNYYCSTNNNRPCGGLRGSPCKHLDNLLEEAAKQYGLTAVARYLQVPEELDQIKRLGDILRHSGQVTREPISAIFSRFLVYLQLVELPTSSMPVPEMDWYTSGG